jgi:hypothetical protein
MTRFKESSSRFEGYQCGASWTLRSCENHDALSFPAAWNEQLLAIANDENGWQLWSSFLANRDRHDSGSLPVLITFHSQTNAAASSKNAKSNCRFPSSYCGDQWNLVSWCTYHKIDNGSMIVWVDIWFMILTGGPKRRMAYFHFSRRGRKRSINISTDIAPSWHLSDHDVQRDKYSANRIEILSFQRGTACLCETLAMVLNEVWQALNTWRRTPKLARFDWLCSTVRDSSISNNWVNRSQLIYDVKLIFIA